MRIRRVIDSNFLQCDALRKYLAKSSQNIAVLTDYAFMEAYKADTLAILYRSMAILSQYPKQVIVLKGTRTVCGLSGRGTGLQKRLIDEKQTQGFAEYCGHLISAQRGDRFVETQLLEYAREARRQMELILGNAQDFGGSLEELMKEFKDGEIQTIRRGLPYTEDMYDKFIKIILLMSASMFAKHPSVTKRPDARELPNTFIFRMALCMYLLAHRWISVGGAKLVKPQGIRNDLIDVSFAAYGTYFHGVLSADKKVNAIYRDANFALTHIFIRPTR